MTKCITGNWKNAKYSPWLDLVAILTGKPIFRGSSKWITVVDNKHFWCFCTHETSTFWSYKFFWCKLKPDYICCWNWIILQLLHNKKGGTISAACNKLAKDIWNWVKGQDIWITASHVPMVGHYCWSQITSDNEEWFLNERVVKSLFDQIGKREIDLFTSRLNTKCSKYESYKPDPDAYHVNAFSLCWLNLNSYLSPI